MLVGVAVALRGTAGLWVAVFAVIADGAIVSFFFARGLGARACVWRGEGVVVVFAATRYGSRAELFLLWMDAFPLASVLFYLVTSVFYSQNQDEEACLLPN